jgi:DNA transposition AAA+ family ATPase
MTISQQLRDAIKTSGLSLAQLSRDAGVHQPGLSRFLSDDPEQHRDIRMEATADKLAAFFGLELRAAAKPAQKSKRGKP